MGPGLTPGETGPFIQPGPADEGSASAGALFVLLWDLSQNHLGPAAKLMMLAPTELAVFPDPPDWPRCSPAPGLLFCIVLERFTTRRIVLIG